jgi:hypothetical protein
MMDPDRARDILDRTGAGDSDFHTLDSAVVDALLSEADHVKYRKPKNANGSRARMFCAYLQRRAAPAIEADARTDSLLLTWIIRNLLTEPQLAVKPPGYGMALRYLAYDAARRVARRD